MKRVMAAMVVLLLVMAVPVLAGDTKACDGNAKDCMKKLQAKYEHMAWLGISYDEDDSGRWVVSAVEPDSPAQAAGFEKGDVMLAINGEAYSKDNKANLKAVYSKLEPGSQATYVVLRQGAKKKLTATLGKVPVELQKKWIAQHIKKHHPEMQMASK